MATILPRLPWRDLHHTYVYREYKKIAIPPPHDMSGHVSFFSLATVCIRVVWAKLEVPCMLMLIQSTIWKLSKEMISPPSRVYRTYNRACFTTAPGTWIEGRQNCMGWGKKRKASRRKGRKMGGIDRGGSRRGQPASEQPTLVLAYYSCLWLTLFFPFQGIQGVLYFATYILLWNCFNYLLSLYYVTKAAWCPRETLCTT